MWKILTHLTFDVFVFQFPLSTSSSNFVKGVGVDFVSILYFHLPIYIYWQTRRVDLNCKDENVCVFPDLDNSRSFDAHTSERSSPIPRVPFDCCYTITSKRQYAPWRILFLDFESTGSKKCFHCSAATKNVERSRRNQRSDGRFSHARLSAILHCPSVRHSIMSAGCYGTISCYVWHAACIDGMDATTWAWYLCTPRFFDSVNNSLVHYVRQSRGPTQIPSQMEATGYLYLR
jgi:hypothetical protein